MRLPYAFALSSLVLIGIPACGGGGSSDATPAGTTSASGTSSSTSAAGGASTTTSSGGAGGASSVGGAGGAGAAGGAGGAGGGAVDPGALAAPPAGKGVQLATGAFDVPPGTDEQDCHFFAVADLAKAAGLDPTKPLNVHRVEIAARPGTHSTRVFRVKTVVNLGPDGGAVQKGTNGAGACFDRRNWADWPVVANSLADGHLDWTYPDGVATILKPEEVLMLQTHYADTDTQKTDAGGRVSVNLWTMPDSDVEFELGTILASRTSIRVCQSNPTPTFEGFCNVNGPVVHVIGASGQMNSRGTLFEMYAWDGVTQTKPDAAQRFYSSSKWDAPVMAQSPALAVDAPAKGGVFYSCSYDWKAPPAAIGCDTLNAYDEKTYMTPAENVDCCYTAGPLVDEHEVCDAYVYYYPKQDDVNCF
jgi:hypothetical protein